MPALVRRTPVLLRTSSCNPIASSSRCMARLREDCRMASRSAARVMFEVRATSRK
ncbi:MAG: hypothetical protein QM765_40505 [Myxococcales bacterium]